MKRLILVLLLCPLLGLTSCSTKEQSVIADSPAHLAETYIEAVYNQDIQLVNDCYGKTVITRSGDDADNLRYRYFKAAGANKLTILASEELAHEQGVTILGIAYELRLEDKAIPGYEQLFITQIEGAWRILSEADTPDECKTSWQLQKALSESESYQDYQTKQEAFEAAWPDYQLDIYGKAAGIIITDADQVSRSDKTEIRNILLAVIGITVMELILMGIWCFRIIKIKRRKGENRCRSLKKNDADTAKSKWMSTSVPSRTNIRTCRTNWRRSRKKDSGLKTGCKATKNN